MEGNKQRQKIYLAGLLHDIGKFYQRAEKDEFNESNLLSQQVRENIENLSHDSQDGYAKYAHSVYTQQFLEEFSDDFEKFFSDKSEKDDNFINLAIYHHKTRTELQKYIQHADWWSSGIDHKLEYEKEGIEDDYRERPLNSIFKIISIDDKDGKVKNQPAAGGYYKFSLNELTLEKTAIFPTDKANTSQSKYKELWEKFKAEFKDLPKNNFRVFADTLYYLLQKYLWCIPASTLKNEKHESNLFEHSKTTAAIALSLYDFCREQQLDSIEKLNRSHRPLLLVSIDVSGIQSFIYNISSKGAAKAMKGRSFYLQLLMDTIINELLYGMDYYRSNVLYSTGGKAYLLLPNINSVNEGLREYQTKLDEWLFKKFNGDLYVSIGKAGFYFDREKRDEEGVLGKRYLIGEKSEYSFIGDLWKASLDESLKVKNQRFRTLIEKGEHFFEPYGCGGLSDVCDLTGVELNKANQYKDNSGEHVFHESVGEQIELGRILKSASFFVWRRKSQPDGVKSKHLKILDSEWLFYDDNTKPSGIDNAVIFRSIDSRVVFLRDTIGGNSVKAFRFYAGGTEINSFEDLVDKDADFKRLAAFVMDVDNLGRIFVEGLKERDEKGELKQDYSSFSQLSTLSFYLDLFFSGYVNKIKEKYDKIMVVYSGGDDLLAVGEWMQIIEFAKELRDEFYEYVGRRSEISISGGIHLFQEKYPIGKAVENAKEAEQKAKSYNDSKKGNITILNQPIQWKKEKNNEFDRVVELKNKMIDFFNQELINSSFIQKFQTYYVMKEQGKKTGNLSYRWNVAYYLKRYEKRRGSKITKDFSEFLECVYNDLHDFLSNASNDLFLKERDFDLYALAARWTELELRSTKNINKKQLSYE